MKPYIYEMVDHGSGEPKIFITAIRHSYHHWHYDHELILVLRGSVILNTQGRSHMLRDGDFYWINSHIGHSIERVEDNLCLFIQMGSYLFYGENGAGRSYSFYLNNQDPEMCPRNGYEAYRRLAARIGLEHQKGESANIHRIRSYIYEFVANLLDYAVYDVNLQSVENEKESDAQLLMQIIDYTYQEYWRETVIEDVQRHFGMSGKTMYRFLKKYLGLSLKELVMETRLEQARKSLKSTDKPIDCIAAECGFGSETTLYRAFRKSIGITPAEYRKNDLQLDLPQNRDIQGYMSYNPIEAYVLLTAMEKGDRI